MKDLQKHRRLRLLLKKLNQERKRQAKKIDILCNDLIAAQREFIKKLDTISFTAGFYEAIIDSTELNSLLYTAGELIKKEISGANVVFFLRQQENFKLHLFENKPAGTTEKYNLENCFNSELVDNICKSNKLCTLDSLCEIGLQGNPAMLNKISVATIPLEQCGASQGFILIYCSSPDELTAVELNHISTITRGLSRAIASCQAILHPAN